mmetsp:Transcript_32826/g.60509  ORF Transcript_32826/g.60509 Transcript_32826/m.60509 type:complete len:322 (+) Transcript_32826:24-989(+)
MVNQSLRSVIRAVITLSWLQLVAIRSVASFAPSHVPPRRPIEAKGSFVASSCHQLNRNYAEKSSQQQTYLTNKLRHRWLSSSMSLFSQPQKTTSTNNVSEEQPEELTPETIAEMIEVAFLQSCLQLSQGYIDVLKLFIVAVKAGYELPLPLEDLHRLVQECPVNSAGRELMKEEKALRLEWMTMVYEMLNALKSDVEVESVDNDHDAAKFRISAVVQAMLSIQNGLQNEEESTGGKIDATVALNTLSVEQALERSPSLSKLNESLLSDPMGMAFLTNDIRVALMTFRVIEEERVCTEDASGRTTSGAGNRGEVPRPPIPGT